MHTSETNHIRQQIRQQRKTLSTEFQQRAASDITKQILQLEIFIKANKIAAYIAVKGEANPEPIVNHAWQEKKICCLPLIEPQLNGVLLFIKYTARDQLTLNEFKIPQPSFDQEKIIPPDNLTIIITPLVAFDANCNRIGMGGGYYDRTFAFKKTLPKSSPPYLIGIAYEMQKIPKIKTEHWDVQLDAVVTEKQIYHL